MTCINRAPEDQYELALVIRHRMRHHQGQSGVEQAVQEAAQLDWRFCQSCGSETAWDGEICTGCGRKGTESLATYRQRCERTSTGMTRQR